MTDESSNLVMGRYRIARKLATGGMGEVYLARIEGAEGFTRPAVIKRMLPGLSQDDELVEMFIREARILAHLAHPNIVAVLDFASEGDAHLMALEYVHGYSLGHWAKYLRKQDEPFGVEHAIWIVAQVLDALHYAHTRTDASGASLGIVHRDVSPTNVLLDVEGHVRLVDFGVARPLGEHSVPKAGEVTVRGKFPYTAPELLTSGVPAARTDLYACGVLLHELLRGENEFRDRDLETTLTRVLSRPLSPLSALRADVPAALDAVIQRATAKKPEQRFEDAAAMAEALRALLPMREDRLRTELRTRLRADFFGDLPEALHLDRLDVLEEAWKAEHEIELRVSEPPAEPEARREASSAVRAELPTQAATLKVGNPGSGRWILAGAIVIALAALGGAALLALAGQRDGPDRVVVVERRLGPAGGPPTSLEAPEGLAPDDDAADDDAAPDQALPPAEAASAPTPGTSEPEDRMAALTRIFNRRQGRLRACFESHALELSGRPQVSIRLHINAGGSVEQAEIVPPELERTALGSCLVGVARGVEFGRQPRPLTVRIPIQVRGG